MPTSVGGRPRNPKRPLVLRDYQKLKRGRELVSGFVGIWNVPGILTLRDPKRTDYRYTLAQVCQKHGVNPDQVSKWAKAIGFSRQAPRKPPSTNEPSVCPECGGPCQVSGRCRTCVLCGWSVCS